MMLSYSTREGHLYALAHPSYLCCGSMLYVAEQRYTEAG